MKRVLYALCISFCYLSGNLVQAKDLKVTSSVYKSNCEVAFFQDGIPVTVVDIGTASLNAIEKGPEIFITMRPTDKYDKNCFEQAARISEVAWVGNLDSKGILAQSGPLKNSKTYLELLPLNDQQKRPVTRYQNILHFDPNLLLTDGHQYRLQLVGGTEAGAYYSAIAWAVSWI
ncbi:MAG: hypothetical protein KH020_12130 [Clostridiales bacterium]|nr:hypothetical protein [Clostridiales bacterium]